MNGADRTHPTDRLLVGPVLRRVTNDTASIWVETAMPATVEVTAGSGHGRARTFSAFGHHYALVLVTGLDRDADLPYEVALDGESVWPPPDSPYPPSRIRTGPTPGTAPVRLMFGSCREASPYTGDGLPPDALDAYARMLSGSRGDPADRPDLLLLLGDQVYADETSPATRRFLRRRRAMRTAGSDTGPPAEEVCDFEEYTRLYHESWRDPDIRWLLSTVPTVMIFDDHEIVDDWNTSAVWRERVSARPWWHRRIVGALASYWVYQHLGNLAPDELATDPTATEVLAETDGTGRDATALLTRLALAADHAADPDVTSGARTPRPAPGPQRDTHRPGTVAAPTAARWSYRHDVGRTRLIVLDNRCGRVLTPGARRMLPESDWAWLGDQVTGDYDHLVIGASLPWLLPPAIHELEAWNERLCDSPHPWVAAGAEWLRQFADLEHWAAFRTSFERFGRLLRDVARGKYTTRPPASITVLSGDVHHSYVAEALLDPDTNTRIYQLTCSPTHNQAPLEMRVGFRLGWSRPAAAVSAGLARLAGVPRPEPRWQRRTGPFFDNAVGILELSGRAARVRLDGTERAPDSHPRLRPLAQVPLTWRSGQPGGPL